MPSFLPNAPTNFFKRTSVQWLKFTLSATTRKVGEYPKKIGLFHYIEPAKKFYLNSATLLGSNEAEQGKNSDWKVDNGVLDRTIQISVLDQQSNLIDIKGAVHIYPTPSDIDIAVLEIDQGTYPTLALGDPLSSATGVHDVAFVGFLKAKTNPMPTVTAGHVEGLNYVTKLPSDEGQSGGSWIDLESGKVFAAPSGVLLHRILHHIRQR